MRYVIYGAGGIGCVIGASLARAGHVVVLIARGAHLAALQENGLVLERPAGTETFRLAAVGDPRNADITPVDRVILTMKSQDTAAALRTLGTCADFRVPVLCAQNGIENERLATRLFENVYAALLFMAPMLVRPGVVQSFQDSPEGVIDLGRYPGSIDTLAESMAAHFRAAGFSSGAIAGIMRWKHYKLIHNAQMAVKALCRPGGETDRLIEHTVAEAEVVCTAAGLKWASESEASARRSGVKLGLIRGQHRLGTASWQSLGRGTGVIESDWLNGEIVLIARRHGLRAPLNVALQTLSNEIARHRGEPAVLEAAAVWRRANELQAQCIKFRPDETSTATGVTERHTEFSSVQETQTKDA